MRRWTSSRTAHRADSSGWRCPRPHGVPMSRRAGRIADCVTIAMIVILVPVVLTLIDVPAASGADGAGRARRRALRGGQPAPGGPPAGGA